MSIKTTEIQMRIRYVKELAYFIHFWANRIQLVLVVSFKNGGAEVALSLSMVSGVIVVDTGSVAK